MLTAHAASAELQAVEAIFPNWREMVARWLWSVVDALEAMDGEEPIYTFKFRVWKLPASFTFRVKHLRYVAGKLLGART